MKIALLQTGKTSENYLREGTAVFEERIRKYTAFEVLTTPDIKRDRKLTDREQKKKEGEHILRLLRNDDFLVILDEKGREFSTRDFAGWLEKTMMIQKKRLVFVIGGPWGVSEEVMTKADLSISLSKFTFSHQMVRLLFLEQLYRAFTVIRGEPYHHD